MSGANPRIVDPLAPIRGFAPLTPRLPGVPPPHSTPTPSVTPAPRPGLGGNNPLVKLYTRTGDDGTTGLIGGARVDKDDLRIETYGTVDETNAIIGLAAVAADDAARPLLVAVQADLFALGSHLAAPGGGTAKTPLPGLPDAARLEAEIDAATASVPPLATFVLPGGCELAARLHAARCVARRAERLAVRLARDEAVPAEALVYLNRLSDWLFAQARAANGRAGVGDVPWVPDGTRG